jgi:hypothetical protein
VVSWISEESKIRRNEYCTSASSSISNSLSMTTLRAHDACREQS